MKKTAYGTPYLLNSQNERVPLEKEAAIDELSIQSLIFEEPDCLPISDIDESYNPVIPVCTELNTPVGPLDVLLVSRQWRDMIIPQLLNKVNTTFKQNCAFCFS
ncbi:hypothetical protein SAMN04488028_102587 [Reichenbachiella agariperforans]|uniref:Uncharacterized protein n=1 Tax=Reichenbachiella agariperforans TaxID=156994 RepID=A0A1M6P8A2_REIAG|nr:hypothetical protein [Reichenbachiella agariperforans]SHK04132.1 hypothetical protein SAMN04488028_102587 [Reichenbachiella agariperforans]